MQSSAELMQPPVRRPGLVLPRKSDIPVYCAAVVGYLMLLPPQLNVLIADSVIPPYRFFLIAASLYVLSSAVRGRVRFVWPDIFIVLAVAWICLAMSMTSTADEAVKASVAHIADIGLAYFFARMAIVDVRDLRMLLVLILPGLFVTGLLIALESVTFTHIIQETASRLTGRPHLYRSSPRLGLMRAQGPFPHPISAGIFLASFLPLYWLAGFKGWVKVLGSIAAFCSFFTVSSAALVALSVSSLLLIYNWLSLHIANLTWRIFFFFAAMFTFLAEFGTNSGTFGLLMRFASLNSDSAFMRVHIWNFGSHNVKSNPWFGIGYGDWDRPSWMGGSVDNYWLFVAMRFGILPSTLIALATIMAVILIARRSMVSTGIDQQTHRGIAIALSVFAIGLISVAVWLSTQVWFFMLLGLTVSIATAPVRPNINFARR